MSSRPEWDYKVPIHLIEDMYYNVIKITHHSELTGVDTSRNWIEFHTDELSFVAPDGWQELFVFKPSWRCLLHPTYKGSNAIKRLQEIRLWEKQNKRDLDELARLKSKLGLT